jgi:hypothetical protein
VGSNPTLSAIPILKIQEIAAKNQRTWATRWLNNAFDISIGAFCR